MTSLSASKQSSYPLLRAEGLLLESNTPKGRGVFASKPISKGTIIETSPVLIFTYEEADKHASQTCLQHYTYYWPDPEGGPQTQAIALGLGSMFNHSRLRQNVIWSRDVERGLIVYTACRGIEVGEELCISYGNGRLWFKDADADSEAEELSGMDEMASSGLNALAMADSHESS